MLFHIALGQFAVTSGEPYANLSTVRSLAATAAEQGAELLVLPDQWTTGSDLAQAVELADHPNTGVQAQIAVLAFEQRLALAGATVVRHADRPTSTATLYSGDGVRLGTYDKIHLVSNRQEPDLLAQGQTPRVFHTPWGWVALAIGYDLYFPELFRAYAVRGAQVVCVVAAWPVERINHWRALARARAIENQYFVVAVNRVGSDDQQYFGGHSLVVDPEGTVLVEGDDQAALLYAQLDLEQVQATRQKGLLLEDCQPGAYPQ